MTLQVEILFQLILLMEGGFSAFFAVFFQGQFILGFCGIFFSDVISAFAFGAFKPNAKSRVFFRHNFGILH
jgi:hypothetical protein